MTQARFNYNHRNDGLIKNQGADILPPALVEEEGKLAEITFKLSFRKLLLLDF